MSTAIARNLMAEMKLPGMLAAFDKTVTDATRDAVSYTEFLDALLQAEADYRGERAAQRRLKAARLPIRVWRRQRDHLLPALLLVWFVVQMHVALNEGRYRKPAEGLLIVQMLVLAAAISSWRRTSGAHADAVMERGNSDGYVRNGAALQDSGQPSDTRIRKGPAIVVGPLLVERSIQKLDYFCRPEPGFLMEVVSDVTVTLAGPT